jgi:hypothetical protein
MYIKIEMYIHVYIKFSVQFGILHDKTNDKSYCYNLPDCHGFQTTRLRHELIWERLGNTYGGAGRNIAVDQINEHLNNAYKGLI